MTITSMGHPKNEGGFWRHFFFLALVNPLDNRHKEAITYTAAYQGKIITTSWVLVELADAMSQRQNRSAFLKVFRQRQSDPDVSILPPDQNLLEEGLKLFGQRLDKDWSLTDCISFVVMNQRQIWEALTGDHHFEQAGFSALLK